MNPTIENTSGLTDELREQVSTLTKQQYQMLWEIMPWSEYQAKHDCEQVWDRAPLFEDLMKIYEIESTDIKIYIDAITLILRKSNNLIRYSH